MAVIKLEMYRCRDGKCFDNKADADAHERRVAFADWMQDHTTISTLTAVNELELFDFLTENFADIHELITGEPNATNNC